MTERTELLESITDTVKDYRSGEITQFSPDHVDKWVTQFEDSVQVPLLREMDHVLKQTYFAKTDFEKYFVSVINQPKLTGNDHSGFWQASRLFEEQQNGDSQNDINQIFIQALQQQYGIDAYKNGGCAGTYIYFDDVLFTGSRIRNDLLGWIRGEAPSKGVVHIILIATYSFGEWITKKQLDRMALDNGKSIEFHIWASLRLENTKFKRNRSEVLWPTVIPGDAELKAYLLEEKKYPFEPRQVGEKTKYPIFSSEEGRQLLERELLLAGMKIRAFCREPSPVLRPLGFSPYGLGFGSTIVTYRNCPNNAPLALWWGNPNASLRHPFSKWYPLFPRKTYSEESELIGFFGS